MAKLTVLPRASAAKVHERRAHVELADIATEREAARRHRRGERLSSTRPGKIRGAQNARKPRQETARRHAKGGVMSDTSKHPDALWILSCNGDTVRISLFHSSTSCRVSSTGAAIAR